MTPPPPLGDVSMVKNEMLRRLDKRCDGHNRCNRLSPLSAAGTEVVG